MSICGFIQLCLLSQLFPNRTNLRDNNDSLLLFTSTVTVLLNGTIAGYVLATELGVLQPLSQAIEEVRNQLVSLVGYAIVWSGVVSTFVILDWISRVGILTGPLNVAVQISAFGMNFAWALGTVFVSRFSYSNQQHHSEARFDEVQPSSKNR